MKLNLINKSPVDNVSSLVDINSITKKESSSKIIHTEMTNDRSVRTIEGAKLVNESHPYLKLNSNVNNNSRTEIDSKKEKHTILLDNNSEYALKNCKYKKLLESTK